MDVPKSFLSTLKAGFFSSARARLETALLAGRRDGRWFERFAEMCQGLTLRGRSHPGLRPLANLSRGRLPRHDPCRPRHRPGRGALRRRPPRAAHRRRHADREAVCVRAPTSPRRAGLNLVEKEERFGWAHGPVCRHVHGGWTAQVISCTLTRQWCRCLSHSRPSVRGAMAATACRADCIPESLYGHSRPAPTHCAHIRSPRPR